MPYKHESDGKIIPRSLRRSVKLTPEQLQEIRDNVNGLSIHSLAKHYNVSRRLIQFTLYPERHAKNLLDRQKRGGSSRYYNKEYQAEKIRECRQYRTKLDKENLLKEPSQ